MVQALAVLPIGSTSFSSWAVKPKETSEAHSRYSSSGAVCSVNSSLSGLKVLYQFEGIETLSLGRNAPL